MKPGAETPSKASYGQGQPRLQGVEPFQVLQAKQEKRLSRVEGPGLDGATGDNGAEPVSQVSGPWRQHFRQSHCQGHESCGRRQQAPVSDALTGQLQQSRRSGHRYHCPHNSPGRFRIWLTALLDGLQMRPRQEGGDQQQGHRHGKIETPVHRHQSSRDRWSQERRKHPTETEHRKYCRASSRRKRKCYDHVEGQVDSSSSQPLHESGRQQHPDIRGERTCNKSQEHRTKPQPHGDQRPVPVTVPPSHQDRDQHSRHGHGKGPWVESDSLEGAHRFGQGRCDPNHLESDGEHRQQQPQQQPRGALATGSGIHDVLQRLGLIS